MSTDIDLDKPVEVRRRAGLAVALGAGASLVAIAYLARAVSHGAVLDWVLFVALGVIGVVNLAALLDARTPLLIADGLGVRLRLGRTWVGLPWGGLHEIEHRPRRGLLRDGLLVVRPHYVQRVIEDLDPRARRTARLNRRLHRAPLAVPLGLATRTIGAEPHLTAALESLAGGRTPVVETAVVKRAVPDAPVLGTPVVDTPVLETPVMETSVMESPVAEPPVVDTPVMETPVVEAPVEISHTVSVAELLAAHGVEGPSKTPRRVRDPRPAVALLIGRVAARFERKDRAERPEPTARQAEEEYVEPAIIASQTPEPSRAAAVAARAEVRSEARVELDPFEEDTSVWGELHAEPETEVVAPLLIDAYAASPAEEPLIGPQFASARRRLRLTVDELADRTRIRPHVIEAIEVDDFSACGGDFYARGHLRTLARVLGLDVAPLLEVYDERYADAPIDPRRVFEAELAGAGSIRATRGGPNWSVLVAAVMALILCWSVARLVTGGPAHVPDHAVLSGSGGPNHSSTAASAPVPVVVTAPGGGARVVVRNGVGAVVFSGELAIGQQHRLVASPPVRVQSTDGAVRVQVAGQDRGRIGPAGSPASASYVVRR